VGLDNDLTPFIVIFKYERAEWSSGEPAGGGRAVRLRLCAEAPQTQHVLPDGPQHLALPSLPQVLPFLSSTPNSCLSHVSYNLDHNPYTPAFVGISPKVSAQPSRKSTPKTSLSKYTLEKVNEYAMHSAAKPRPQKRKKKTYLFQSLTASFARFAAKNSKTTSAYFDVETAHRPPDPHQESGLVRRD
jgi:hypothetical protein